MLKIAIVGCGKIADAHASQILRVGNCGIVGVCDREPLMARQLYDRFAVNGWYSDLEKMLQESRPDVVHITTPPEGHFGLAMRCLEAGAHVYVEKPFTVYEHEAAALINCASRQGLKITVGHDDQFSHVARRMRTLVHEGYLGSKPVHMESHYCYELGENAYSGALLGDKNHWVRRLPGKLLQNIISHGIARIAEFLTGDTPEVTAQGWISSFLRQRGEREIIDELRVVIADENSTTAYFTFSSQMRPALHMFRIYGDRNGLILDQDQETLIRLRGKRHKSYVEKFAPPFELATQYLGNLRTNLGYFMDRDFHMKSGMRHLIASFYRSIEEDAPVPIPYREILLTTRIMESIFSQLETNRRSSAAVLPMDVAHA